MQLGRRRCRFLEKVSFENSLGPVAGLPIPSNNVRVSDRNRYGCSPNLSQACFSLLTDCSTSESGKFCGANETTVQILRGAGLKNCRLMTFHVPCVPVCWSTLGSVTSVRTNLTHFLRLDRKVNDGPPVLDVGRLEQAGVNFHRTKRNFHADLREK